MCNYQSIFKLLFSRMTISPFMLMLIAFVFSTAETVPAEAQIPGAAHSLFTNPSDQFELMGSGVRVLDVGMGAFPTSPTPALRGESKVSADELRHPLSDKARSILQKAWNYSTKGDHSRAIAVMKEGMAKVRSLVPYGHGFLGIEYVRTGHPKEAAAELKESIELFPHDAPNHSNFALSLCLTGDLDDAEREAKLALYLEPTLTSAAEIVRLVEETKAKRESPAPLSHRD